MCGKAVPASDSVISLQIQLSWFAVHNLSFRNKMYCGADTAVLALSKLEPAGSVAAPQYPGFRSEQ